MNILIKRQLLKKVLLLLFFILTFPKIFPDELKDSVDAKQKRVLSLNDCIEIAIENNQAIKVSKEDINIAKAQIRQAESGYWPQLNFKTAYTLMDQDPNFILPSSEMSLPLTLPGLSLNLDNIPVPEQNVKLMDKQNLHGELSLTYPLYTGGKVQSVNKQAEYGYEIAKQKMRKTDQQVKYDVKRYYYAVVLTEKLYDIAKDALEKLNATLRITENFYKNGSGKVTKIDYLRNKVIVEQASSLVYEIKGKLEKAKEALRFTLGSDIPAGFVVSSKEIPFNHYVFDADSIAKVAYHNNPDWLKINSAIEVYKSKVDEAQSGYLPSVALFGSLNQNINSYDYGVVSKDNKTIWTVGLGLEMPIFSGFRTSGEVDEAEAGLSKIKEQKQLLQSAILLQVRNACSDIKITSGQVEKTLEAKKTAEENTSLNERAYLQDMVETKDLIEAQIMESFIKAQYQKALYDHYDAQIRLELIEGQNN